MTLALLSSLSPARKTSRGWQRRPGEVGVERLHESGSLGSFCGNQFRAGPERADPILIVEFNSAEVDQFVGSTITLPSS
jgi:hypothetical protein